MDRIYSSKRAIWYFKETYAYALILEEFFFKRFIDTCNIEVSQLAYVLTPEGLYDFRSKHVLDSPEFFADLKALKQCLVSIASYKQIRVHWKAL